MSSRFDTIVYVNDDGNVVITAVLSPDDAVKIQERVSEVSSYFLSDLRNKIKESVDFKRQPMYKAEKRVNTDETYD